MNCTLTEVRKRFSSREFTILNAHLDYGIFFQSAKEDLYLAQIAKFIVMAASSEHSNFKLDDFLLTLSKGNEAELDPEERMRRSKQALSASLGIDVEGLTNGGSA